jgi:uncharacterized protein YdeI (BOF family)
MKRNFFVLPLICMILSACEGETIDPSRAGKSIRLTADIEGLKTRVSGSTWEKGDAIGVYMKKAGESLNSAVLANNINYIYNDAGNFNPKDELETIYFPFNGSDVDFIGYYPFSEAVSNFTYPVKLTSQSNQAVIDLMYSNNATAMNMSNPNVNMTFSHRLSKLELQIAHYRSLELEDLSVIITQVTTEASFDLANGILTPSSTEPKNIALHVSSDGSVAVAEAILLPGTDLSASELWFIIGNNEQIYRSSLTSIMPRDTLAQSTLHSLNVTLFTDEEAAIVETVSITPWDTLPLVSDTANRTDSIPPEVKGLITAPYSVTEAQAAQGELAVWVKGYIVGAFDGSINKFVTDTTGQVRTNIALSDNMSETDISKMIPVNVTGSISDALNIVDNPGNINRLVLIKGDLAEYYSVPALREVTDYQFPN